eukprot:jgi/Chlat1/5959/Chrsp4S09082
MGNCCQKPKTHDGDVEASKKQREDSYRPEAPAGKAQEGSPKKPSSTVTGLASDSVAAHQIAALRDRLSESRAADGGGSGRNSISPDGGNNSDVLDRKPPYSFASLPIDAEDLVSGDTFVAYEAVDESADASAVPYRAARAMGDSEAADRHKLSLEQQGYRLITLNGGNPDDSDRTMASETLAVKHTIRMSGVACPELAQPQGSAAMQALRSSVAGRACRIRVMDVNADDGVELADVRCGPLFLQEMLLRRGLAWHRPGQDNSNNSSFVEWEAEAREARRGLWKSDSPVPPWKYLQDEGSIRTASASGSPKSAQQAGRKDDDSSTGAQEAFLFADDGILNIQEK